MSAPIRLTLTGLDGPAGRPSRADMGAAARRALPFPTLGAFYGGLQVHGPNPRCTCRPGSLGFCAGCVGVDFMARGLRPGSAR